VKRSPATGRVAPVLLLLALVACGERTGPATGGDTPRNGGTVVIAAPQDLEAANSLLAQNRYTQELLRYALFLPLVAYGPQLQLEPALARSWEMTGDTGVVFQLRNDVHWQDGAITSAYDVAFTYERAKDTLTAFPNAGDFLPWNGAEVQDSFRIRFRWQPHGDPLAGLPFLPIMPKHLLDSVPANALGRAAFNHSPVGNGPFRFVQYLPNDRWVFEANPDFPAELGGRPHIDRLVWRVIPDNTAQVTELRTGTADVVLNARAEVFRELAADSQLQSIVRPSRQYAFIGWNGRHPPLGDARVRRALTLALDRQQMIDVLRDSSGTVAVGPIGPYHWSFADSVKPLPHDTTAARALLAQAGIQDRNGDGVLERPDGGRFGFELLIPAANPFNRDMAELIRTQLAALGVEVRIAPVEQNTLIGRITSPQRDFDAVLMAWESDFRINLGDLFHSASLGGPLQIAGYSSAAVDSLIDRSARLVDREQARPLYVRLQQLLRDDEPWTFLFYYPDLYLTSARLRGVEMDIRGAFVSLPRWWVTDAGR
jgi:peptide/nickel transport system substrate-binding protein